jgi:molecular chaperone DnaK (HSP70)
MQPIDVVGRFAEGSSTKTIAAPIIDHQNEPAYAVKVLEKAPIPQLLQPTPRGSHAATPLQSPPPEPPEPVYVSRTLTVSEVATIIIRSLVNSASDFLGQAVKGAVITVPSQFSSATRDALMKAAEATGVQVLQLLDDAAAASLAYSSLQKPSTDDRLTLVLDLGASSLDLNLLSIKQGLAHVIASSHTPHVGGDAIDDKLVAYFAKEFTKKTKVELSPTSTDPTDLRALTKLRLAVEHTKRTLSASPGAASCNVESLKDGLDFSGTINRIRFDMEVKAIYATVTSAVKHLLHSADIDSVMLDDVILVGSTAILPGLKSQLETTLAETTEIRSEIDPSQVLSRGAAIQAGLLASISPNDPLLSAFQEGCEALSVNVITKPLGIIIPGNESDAAFVQIMASETALPARRTVSFVAQLLEKEGSQTIGLEIWEGKETVKVTKTKLELDPEDAEEDEEPEEIETREKLVEKETCLTSLQLSVVGSRTGKKKKGPLQATVMLTFILAADRKLEVIAHEKGSSAAPTELQIDV